MCVHCPDLTLSHCCKSVHNNKAPLLPAEIRCACFALSSWTPGHVEDVSQAMKEHWLDIFDALDLVKADDDIILGGIEDSILLVDSTSQDSHRWHPANSFAPLIM